MNHAWALDFLMNQTADERVLKILTVTGKFTKAAIEVKRSITDDYLLRNLDQLTGVHGKLRCIRMDTAQEMTCLTVADWCRFSATGTKFIQLGSPRQNAFVESSNGKLRDQLLAIEVYHALLETKVMAKDCRAHYKAVGRNCMQR